MFDQHHKNMDSLRLQQNINAVLEHNGYAFRLKNFATTFQNLTFIWSEDLHPHAYQQYRSIIEGMPTVTKENNTQRIIYPDSKVRPRPLTNSKDKNDLRSPFAYHMNQAAKSYTSDLCAQVTACKQCTTIQRNLWNWLVLQPGRFYDNLCNFLVEHESAQCVMNNLRTKRGRPCEGGGGYFLYFEEKKDDDNNTYERYFVRVCRKCKETSRPFSGCKKNPGHLINFVNESLVNPPGSPMSDEDHADLILQEYFVFP